MKETEKKENQDGSGADFRLMSGLFFRLLPYQILLVVINAVNGIVDSLFTSNILGNVGMSAIGLYAPMNHFLFALSIVLLGGSQLLYGKYIGNHPEKIDSVFSVDLILSGVISIFTTIMLALVVLTDATSIMVADAMQRHMFNQYLLGQTIGIPALVLGQQLFGFLSLENQTRLTMIVSILCLVSNAVLDYLFVAVIPMGTFGLGLASSIGLIVFFGVQAAYYLAGKSPMKFSLGACQWHDGMEIIRRGYPGALSRFLEMFRCLVVNALILKFVGGVGLSSFAATNSFLAIIWAIPFGMVAVSRMLFSISVGEEDRRSLADIMRVIIRRGVPLMGVVVLAIIAFAQPLTRMFFRDVSDPVYHMTVMGFRIMPLCMPLAVISLTFACYTQAAEKKLLSLVLALTEGFMGVSLPSLVLIPLLQMNGIYIANVMNGFMCLGVILVFAIKEGKHFPRNMEELLAIPSSFGTSKEERLDVTVREINEVEHVSQQIMSFCEGRGIDSRKSYISGLAMEEMAGNVVLHGFTKDRKKHSLDIRVVHKGDEILLRLRDDCVPFNPSDRLKMRARTMEDPCANIGLRVAFSSAKNVQYQNLLGMNVLTIHI